MMRVGSLFSGIGGLDLGLERAGMEVVWQVEIDPFRRRVLERHWPDVERFEDVRDIFGVGQGVVGTEPAPPTGTGRRHTSEHHRRYNPKSSQARKQQLRRYHLGPVDLICGGFPCQDLSVAGRRAGLRAARSGLFFEFARIVGEVLPDWILVENVPGLLSSNGGDDFRIVVDALQGLGYGLSWRILDSRHFGVPQRRRRVYVVGSLGGLRSAAVLFESEGGGGDTPQGREAGEGVAYALAGSPRGTGDGHGNAWNTTYVSSLQGAATGRRGHRNDAEGAAGGQLIVPTIRAAKNRTGGDRPPGTDVDTAESLICAPTDPDGVREAAGVPRRVDARADEMQATGLTGRYRKGADSDATDTFVAAPLEAADGHHGRSSPRGDGADNLMTSDRNEGDEDGVYVQDPDGTWRPIRESDWRKPDPKPCCPDGPRYAALGDAVTVSVAEWIGRRIVMAEAAS